MDKALILALECNEETMNVLLKLSQEAIDRKDFGLAEKIQNIVRKNLTDIQPAVDEVAREKEIINLFHDYVKVGDTE